jgi:hypothetical protein
MRARRLLTLVMVTALTSFGVALVGAPAAFATGPVNDNFASATPVGPIVSGVPANFGGSNVNATAEVNEPDTYGGQAPQHTVWYSITTPGAGQLTLSGTADFPAVWSILVANGTPALGNVFGPTLNVSAAQTGEFGTSWDTGPLAAYPNTATTFYLQVDSNTFNDPPDDIATGNFTLTATFTAAPDNDDLVNAAALGGLSDTATGSTIAATKQASEPLINFHTSNYGGHSVWYTETPTVSGRTDVVVSGEPGYDPALAVYTDSAEPVTMSGLSLVAVDASASSSNSDTSDVRFAAQAGTTYFIRVDGQGPPDAAGQNGSFSLTMTEIPPPANDNFANATLLTTSSGSIDGSNVSATLETDEPLPAVHSGNETVWYAFDPPASRQYEFDTPAADRTFPTQIAIYSGSALASLNEITSNDATVSDSSTVTFDASAGTTYYVQVAGLDSGTTDGNFTLTWQIAGGAPPLPDLTSLSASATNAITAGGSVHVTGVLRDTSTSTAIAGAAVNLFARSGVSGSVFTLVGSAASSASGGVSLVEKPVHNTVYEWRYGGSTSHDAATSVTRSVSVRAAVSATLSKAKVRHRHSVTLFGAVSPTENGQRVVVQERVRGKWKAVAVSASIATLKVRRLPNGTKASGYIINLTEASKGTYSFRVVRAATSTNAVGTSRVVTLRVT